MKLIPIFLHEYTLTKMVRTDKMGIQSVTIHVVTETKEDDSLQAVESLSQFAENSLNISHRITVEGYKQDE